VIARRFGAAVTWLPFAPSGVSARGDLPRAIARALRLVVHDRLRERFAEEGLAYNRRPTSSRTRCATLRVTELAREGGCTRRWHDRLMDAYWAEGRNIGDPRRAARACGRGRLDSARYAVLAGTATATGCWTRLAGRVDRVTGVPGFLLTGACSFWACSRRKVSSEFTQLTLRPKSGRVRDARPAGEALADVTRSLAVHLRLALQ